MIFNEGTIPDPTLQIHYKKVGEGPTVLLIHGYGEDMHIWPNVLQGFANHEVIMIDLPGFGASEDTANYQLHDVAKTVHRWLIAEGRDQYYVMGHSMGGYTAVEFLAEAKDHLLGLGIIHSHPFGDDEEMKKARTKRAEHIDTYGLKGYLSDFYPMLFGSSFMEQRKVEGPTGEEKSTLLDLLFDRGMSYGNVAFSSGMKAMRDRHDRSELLKSFERPVLFIVGDEDKAIPHDQSMSQLHLPNIADIHIYRGVGHMAMFEEPERMIASLKSYFELASQAKSSS